MCYVYGTIRTERSEKVVKTFVFVPAELSAVGQLAQWLSPVGQVERGQAEQVAVQQQEQVEQVQEIRLVS